MTCRPHACRGASVQRDGVPMAAQKLLGSGRPPLQLCLSRCGAIWIHMASKTSTSHHHHGAIGYYTILVRCILIRSLCLWVPVILMHVCAGYTCPESSVNACKAACVHTLESFVFLRRQRRQGGCWSANTSGLGHCLPCQRRLHAANGLYWLRISRSFQGLGDSRLRSDKGGSSSVPRASICSNFQLSDVLFKLCCLQVCL